MNITTYKKDSEILILPETEIKSYNDAIRVFNKWLDGAPVNENSILDYMKHCRDSYRPTTFNHKLNSLKKSLRAIGQSTGQDSTMWKIKIDEIFKRIKPIKIKSNNKKNLTKQQFNDLKKACDPQTAIIIEALYEMACRISELCGIKLTDCQEDGAHYIIDIIGKGNKQHTVFLKKKTYNRMRKLFIGQKYLIEYTTGFKAHRSTIFKKIKKYGREIGLEISPHVLRHTFATLNLKRLGIHKVSRYLNHSDIGITSKFYLHDEATASEILK